MPDEPKKKSRKPSRPRLDTVKRAILSGDYDDVLWELKGAIEERNQRRQAGVMKLVEQVFGDGYVVAPKIVKDNPFLADNEKPRKRPGSAFERQEGEVLPGESPHVQMVTDPLGDDDDGETDPDYESRSPIIGAVEDDTPE